MSHVRETQWILTCAFCLSKHYSFQLPEILADGKYHTIKLLDFSDSGRVICVCSVVLRIELNIPSNPKSQWVFYHPLTLHNFAQNIRFWHCLSKIISIHLWKLNISIINFIIYHRLNICGLCMVGVTHTLSVVILAFPRCSYLLWEFSRQVLIQISVLSMLCMKYSIIHHNCVNITYLLATPDFSSISPHSFIVSLTGSFIYFNT